jgi:hypothetical protein
VSPLPAPPPTFVGGSPQPTAYAIIIGVEKYGAGIDAPVGSRRDAIRFAEMAKSSLGIPSDHIQLELDDQATRASIERSLAWAQASVPQGGRIYFYFSGHGTPDATDKGTAYIVPADGDPKFLHETAVPIPEIIDKLGHSKAKEVIAFVDACFSGAGDRPITRVWYGPPTAQTALFSAAGEHETAGPAPDGAGGLFTTVILDGLGKGEADINGDGQVSLAELNEWVPDRVQRQAGARKQRPTLTVGPGLGSANAVIVEWGLPQK